MSSADSRENYYQMLGVGPDATPAQIKQAYRRCVLATHPDLNPSIVAAERYRRVRRAYEVLGNVDERRRYDMVRGIGEFAGRSRFYRRSFDRLIDGMFRNLRVAVNSTTALSDAVEAERGSSESVATPAPPARRRAG